MKLKKKRKSLIRFWAQKPEGSGHECDHLSLQDRTARHIFEENPNLKDVFYTIQVIFNFCNLFKLD